MMLIKCSIGKSVNQFAILISSRSDAYKEIQILLYTFIVVVRANRSYSSRVGWGLVRFATTPTRIDRDYLVLCDYYAWKDLNLSQFFHIITAVDVNRQCHFPF
ncbi:hypothetical protein T07_3480 [Trichinella nelsoni]|uniref:Uncharacterized protein n=1 Tax=Trichinella nelsoni TaxID=6336 RepID=A0A0V0SDR4_9BILA|nr:hypothetical protein T07_3480 [Trichinella nelsoni]